MVVVDESLKVTAVKTAGGGDFSLGREAICSVIATTSHFEELHHGICTLQIYLVRKGVLSSMLYNSLSTQPNELKHFMQA